jgi:hypothetical protein
MRIRKSVPLGEVVNHIAAGIVVLLSTQMALTIGVLDLGIKNGVTT